MVAKREFRFKCPKCRTGHFGITRLTAFHADIGWDDRVFACSCGKRLYGVAIKEEFDRQKTAHDEKVTKALKDAAQLRRKERAEAEKREQEAAARQPVVVAKASADVCAWKDCDSDTRRNSAYCSRNCSNRNARWRYKRRKETLDG